MSPEEQRIAIAEACGAKWMLAPAFSPHITKVRKFICFTEIYSLDGICGLQPASGDEPITALNWMWKNGCIPDYLNDLNAMHEAVNTLNKELQLAWVCRLYGIVDVEATKPGHAEADFRLAQATATQRAEAFLRILDKWKE